MKTLKFTIYGNQEDSKGNAIPYFRQTQRSARFNRNAIRYHHWKDYVRAAFNADTDNTVNQYKMLEVPVKAYLHTRIFFANKKHADSDNIQKGIKDALFENDKFVAGTYDFDYDPQNPRVECELIFVDEMKSNEKNTPKQKKRIR